eukprot:m.546186 g.546186  ORF g.546186 m.546186 type:complete len:147 (-) comp22150_c0_seq4:2357-2797(-)
MSVWDKDKRLGKYEPNVTHKDKLIISKLLDGDAPSGVAGATVANLTYFDGDDGRDPYATMEPDENAVWRNVGNIQKEVEKDLPGIAKCQTPLLRCVGGCSATTFVTSSLHVWLVPKGSPGTNTDTPRWRLLGIRSSTERRIHVLFV